MAEANKSKMREWTPTDTNQVLLKIFTRYKFENNILCLLASDSTQALA